VGAIASTTTAVAPTVAAEVVPEVEASDGPPALEAVLVTVVGDRSPAPEAVPEMVPEVEEMMVATTIGLHRPMRRSLVGLLLHLARWQACHPHLLVRLQLRMP
jgi:hypothetical protein